MSSNITTFSEVCGENVSLSENKTVATWTPKNSGGWACSDHEVKPGEIIEVKVEGSGRCDVGFVKEEQSPKSFRTLNEIRLVRKTCSILVTFSETGEEVSSCFGEKTFQKRIAKGTKVWVAVYIKYGNVRVELLSNGMSQDHLKFSSNSHGPNINLKNDNTKASSITINPASICFLSSTLQPGSKFRLKCSSENEGGREISRYELKLQVCEICPEILREKFKYLFDASEAKTSDPPLTSVEVFEKDECNGDISVSLTASGSIQYETAKGKQNTQALNFGLQNGVWIVLALYGVKVRVMSGIADESLANIVEEDQTDSRLVATGSQETTASHRTLSEYSLTSEESIERDIYRRDVNLEQNVERMSLDTNSAAQLLSEQTPEQLPTATDTGASGNVVEPRLNVQKYFPFLVQEIETIEFCDHLYAKGILTWGQMEEIHVVHRNRGPSDANRELLKIIKKKPIRQSDMEEITRSTGQSHLLKKFYP